MKLEKKTTKMHEWDDEPVTAYKLYFVLKNAFEETLGRPASINEEDRIIELAQIAAPGGV